MSNEIFYSWSLSANLKSEATFTLYNFSTFIDFDCIDRYTDYRIQAQPHPRPRARGRARAGGSGI